MFIAVFENCLSFKVMITFAVISIQYPESEPVIFIISFENLIDFFHAL